MLVEQAIYTSTQTRKTEGYQLVATSPGVSKEDARALSVWCPSHNAMVESGPTASSINFFPLPSGAYCISRTTLAGKEYSGRSGDRTYTHCLICSGDVLERFSNDPFALMRAAMAVGAMEIESAPLRHLRGIQLGGRAQLVNEPVIEELLAVQGATGIAAWVEAALACQSLALSGLPAERWIAGLMQCLPLECRLEFSFSTGLKFSPRRPFRLFSVLDNKQEKSRLQRSFQIPVFDAASLAHVSANRLTGWAAWLADCLEVGGTEMLGQCLGQAGPGIEVGDLPRLAKQLLLTPVTVTKPSGGTLAPQVAHAHAAHRRFEHSKQDVLSSDDLPAPSECLSAPSVAVVEKLEALDDLVYDSIAGKPEAMEALVDLWTQVRTELAPELVEESREQYMSFAMRVWRQFLQDNADPRRATAVLEVMSLLFDGEADLES